jgi:hypothetical protein
MVVDGDCMAPGLPAGEIVTFSPLEVQRYGVIAGRDYAIQLDGEANHENTFKRVLFDPQDDSVFVLRCVNPKTRARQDQAGAGDPPRRAIWGVASARQRGTVDPALCAAPWLQRRASPRVAHHARWAPSFRPAPPVGSTDEAAARNVPAAAFHPGMD